MIKNVYISRSFILIACLTIILSACKSKKAVNSTAGLEGLDAKFERLYIEACTQSIIGNYSVSLTQFGKCADIKPDEASVYYQISKIRQKLNEEHAAFQNALKANSLAPSNKFYAMHYASFLRKNGDFENAARVLETAINANLSDENLYKNLDAVYDFRNETDKRIALWNKYRENAGLKVSTGLQLVELYKLKKDYTSAHKMLDELKKAAPKKTKFYIDDAKLYEEQNDLVNANLNYERAVEINPDNWEVNYALYKYHLKRNDKAKATIYLKAAFEKSVAGFDAKLPACQELLKQDTTQCAFAGVAANGLVLMNKSDARALFTAAELNMHCSQYKDAYTYYGLAASLNPNLYDAWMGVLKSGIILQQYSGSIETGEKALEYFPNTVALYESLARLYNLDKQYAKATEMAENGERLAFDDIAKASLLLQKGISLYYLKKYTEAQSVLESAITINKSNAELYYWSGNTYHQMNDEKKAEENWKKAKDLGFVNSTDKR